MENISNLLTIQRSENYDLIFEFGLPKHWFMMNSPLVNNVIDRSNDDFTVYKFSIKKENVVDTDEPITDLEIYNKVINHVNKIFDVNNKIDKELEENNKRIEELKNLLLNEFTDDEK